MTTPHETILTALHARLSALSATALRGEVLPERVPAEGLLIPRDREPGKPEVTLSPLRYRCWAVDLDSQRVWPGKGQQWAIDVGVSIIRFWQQLDPFYRRGRWRLEPDLSFNDLPVHCQDFASGCPKTDDIFGRGFGGIAQTRS